MTSDAGYTNVSQPERWFSVIIGAALMAYGLKRRSVLGWLGAVGGVGMLWRGSTGHCMTYELLGISTAGEPEASNVSVPYGKGVRVEKSITVNTSPETLFRFWRNFENLPQFMSHLQSVKVLDSTRSHWKTKGPAGTDVEWDAEVINEVPNELIGWRSVDGAEVNHAGSVHFTRKGTGSEVRVILRYDPPAGRFGDAVAKIFGEDAGSQIAEDLGLLKRLLENQKVQA